MRTEAIETRLRKFQNLVVFIGSLVANCGSIELDERLPVNLCSSCAKGT